MILACSVNQICSRPRSRQTGLPRFPANAAHAGGNALKCAAMKTKFGRWTVQKIEGQFAVCRCSCGTVRKVYKHSLLNGVSTSCGCYRRENVSKIYKTHGCSGSPLGGKRTLEYNSWASMISRVKASCKTHKKYYFDRGITVCKRWTRSGGFENFLKDMGKRPTPSHTLDRINNDGNYEPSNCRWATKKVQANNSRRWK
jgi:hypothetical protein